MEKNRLRVNGERLRKSIEEMAQIGATPRGGVHRLCLTHEDKMARDLLVKWLTELNLEVSIDCMGNIFGRRPGMQDTLPPVMTGSHLDTQPKGGRFDGVLGVLGGLEVIRTISENGISTVRPLMLVNWTNEEGCRFPPAMFSSAVWAGKMDIESAYSQTDISGKKFGEELVKIGYKGAEPARSWPFHAYFELHIEQGPILDRDNRIIGIPKGILGSHWYDIDVEGVANQVGPTPMEGRHDALCAAAEMILKVNELPSKMGGEMVTTVGEIHNRPNSRNTIPDHVHFTIDIRSWDDELNMRAWNELRLAFDEIASRRGCSFRFRVTMRNKCAPFDQQLISLIDCLSDELGYPKWHMLSGAGHDAVHMTGLGPTAMIFVPSINGRSHVEIEETRWEHCEAGANVLLQAMLIKGMEVS